MECEQSQNFKTCRAIVSVVIKEGLDPEDYQRVFLDDAESCESKGRVETARAIYGEMIKEFGSDAGVYSKVLAFETRRLNED